MKQLICKWVKKDVKYRILHIKAVAMQVCKLLTNVTLTFCSFTNFSGGRQGKIGTGNWFAIKANKQLVYQSEKEELAQ